MTYSDVAIDHAHIDWTSVVASSYRITQQFRYAYAEPITRLRHRLIVSPRAHHGDQRRVEHDLHVEPYASPEISCDAFGNDIVVFEIARVEREIAFAFESRVMRDLRTGAHFEDAALLREPAYAAVRRLTKIDERLADTAADLRRTHPAPADLAEAIAALVHSRMTYTKGVSDVFTTAIEAFTTQRGVCQDYAHVMIAIARASGLFARYVSGHLLGEGATHAWVEIVVPAADRARVLAFDPTHGCGIDLRYVVIAVGRDYDDVAPTSGFFTGKASGTLFAHQRVDLTDVTAA